MHALTHWELAPLSMGWQDLSAGELCGVLKDPKLNGNRSLADLVKHMDEDKLVLWGWEPGDGRTKPSLSHDEFAKKFREWVEKGAASPE